MIFYCFSELMLPTLIKRYDKKKKNTFLIQFKNQRLTEILQAVRCHIYDRIKNIYQFIKSFLDKKMSVFEEYGAFKVHHPQKTFKNICRLMDL